MRTLLRDRDLSRGYGVALAAVAVAFAATRGTWPLLQPTPWALFFAAVMTAAWFGGWGPSLAATALSATIGAVFFFAPYGTLHFSRAAWVGTAVFVAVSALISVLSASRRRAVLLERQERRRFQATVTSIGDAVIATDDRGRVEFMNPIAEHLTGWPLGEARGRALDEVFRILNESTREPTPSPVQKVLATGRVQGLANHTILVSRDGTERPIDDSASPIRDDRNQVTGVVLVFRDLTERQREHFLLGEHKQVLELMARGAPLDETLAALCLMIEGQSLAGMKASILLADDEAQRLRIGAAPSLPEPYNRAIDGQAIGPDCGPCASAYRREPVVVPDIAADPSWSGFAELAREHRLAACWSRPIFASGGGLLGTFTMYYPCPRSPEVEDMRFVDLVTRTASVGIESRRTEQSLRRGEDRFRFLDALTQATRALADPVAIMEATTRMLGEQLHATRCAYADMDDDGNGFTIRNDWTDGAPSTVGVYTLDLFGPKAVELLTEGRKLVIRDVDAELEPGDGADTFNAIGIRAIVCCPLVKDGRLAALMAVHQAAPRDWTGDEVTLIGEVVERSWAHVERIRSESTRRVSEARRTDQLRRLTEAAARINSAQDLRSVIGVVTHEARQLIGAHQAESRVYPNAESPESVNAVSSSARTRSMRSMLAPELARAEEMAASQKRVIRIAAAELSTPSPVNGILSAPLVSRTGRELGVIQIADKDGSDFTEDDETILVQLSHVAAVAIENAGLYDELRDNDQRKDEFLAMLAHELRNPLAAISNAVTLTSRGDVGEHFEWAMDVIKRQMKHLSRLIDDLLDASRISSGKVELRREVVEITPILRSAAETVRALVGERKHALVSDLGEGGLWADVDPTRLEQVVVNLLNNAAKYSENGGRIEYSARRVVGQIEIRVKDAGVGIAPENLPQMFDLFVQGNRSLARSEGGLGIGLTVVKKLAELHGGSVKAESEGPGRGSTFTVLLPAASPATAPPMEPARTPAPPPRSARILVVDDNEDMARGMSRLLKILGHDVRTAYDGISALEAAREHRPDFVLLDIGLPGMDGYEVASRLRREEGSARAVIVAVSGYGKDEDRRRTRDAGFDHHLIKPVDHDALFKLLTGPSPTLR